MVMPSLFDCILILVIGWFRYWWPNYQFETSNVHACFSPVGKVALALVCSKNRSYRSHSSICQPTTCTILNIAYRLGNPITALTWFTTRNRNSSYMACSLIKWHKDRSLQLEVLQLLLQDNLNNVLFQQ